MAQYRRPRHLSAVSGFRCVARAAPCRSPRMLRDAECRARRWRLVPQNVRKIFSHVYVLSNEQRQE